MNKYLIIFRNGTEITVFAKKLTITYSRINCILEGYKFEGISEDSDVPQYTNMNEILAIVQKSSKHEVLDA